VFSNEADVVEIGSSLRDKPARELVCPVTISNFKTCAHVGQADMGREVNGPLLARPAGAEVLQLKPPILKHRLPGWLVQPEGKFCLKNESRLQKQFSKGNCIWLVDSKHRNGNTSI